MDKLDLRINTGINLDKGGYIMRCACCGMPLDRAIERQNYKSCPKCSQSAGKHIFYPKENFGWTAKRITINNPDGIQSWCARCRSNGIGPYPDGIECDEV